jgi:hypothetical protein
MSFVCACANPACMVNGCQIAGGYRNPAPHAAPAFVPTVKFAPQTSNTDFAQCRPSLPVTEDDVRRVIRDELGRHEAWLEAAAQVVEDNGLASEYGSKRDYRAALAARIRSLSTPA